MCFRTYSDSSVMTSLEQLPKPNRPHTETTTVLHTNEGASFYSVPRSKTTSETVGPLPRLGSAFIAEEVAVAVPQSFAGDEETHTAAFRQILHSLDNHWWLQEDLDESQLMLAMEERVQQKLPQRQKTQTVKKSALSYCRKLTNIFLYRNWKRT